MQNLNKSEMPAPPFRPSFNAAVKSLIAERLQKLGDYDLGVCHFVVFNAGSSWETIKQHLGFSPFAAMDNPEGERAIPDGFCRSVHLHDQFVEVTVQSADQAYVIVIQDQREEVDPEVSSMCWDWREILA